MAPYRNSRTSNQRRVVSQPDHDVFEGLPVRHWRKRPTHVNTEADKPDAEATSILPSGYEEPQMPKDANLLSETCYAILRAARIGQTRRETLDGRQENGKDGHADYIDESSVLTTQKWSLVPRDLEGPEPEFLAKRRKGLPSLYGVATVSNVVTGPMRKTKIRKLDTDGKNLVWEVLVPEGQILDGEVMEDDTSPTEAPPLGTVIEGIGVANADGVVVAGSQPELTPRRRPPPPKKKHKGRIGRDRKKVAFAPGANGQLDVDGTNASTPAGTNDIDQQSEMDNDGGEDSMMLDVGHEADGGTEGGTEGSEDEDAGQTMRDEENAPGPLDMPKDDITPRQGPERLEGANGVFGDSLNQSENQQLPAINIIGDQDEAAGVIKEPAQLAPLDTPEHTYPTTNGIANELGPDLDHGEFTSSVQRDTPMAESDGGTAPIEPLHAFEPQRASPNDTENAVLDTELRPSDVPAPEADPQNVPEPVVSSLVDQPVEEAVPQIQDVIDSSVPPDPDLTQLQAEPLETGAAPEVEPVDIDVPGLGSSRGQESEELSEAIEPVPPTTEGEAPPEPVVPSPPPLHHENAPQTPPAQPQLPSQTIPLVEENTPVAPTPSPPTPIATSFEQKYRFMDSPRAPTMSPPTPARAQSPSPDFDSSSNPPPPSLPQPPALDLTGTVTSSTSTVGAAPLPPLPGLGLSGLPPRPPPPAAAPLSTPPANPTMLPGLPQGAASNDTSSIPASVSAPLDVEAAPPVPNPQFETEIPHEHNPLDGLAAPAVVASVDTDTVAQAIPPTGPLVAEKQAEVVHQELLGDGATTAKPVGEVGDRVEEAGEEDEGEDLLGNFAKSLGSGTGSGSGNTAGPGPEKAANGVEKQEQQQQVQGEQHPLPPPPPSAA